jgi:hypothetical protein
MIASIMMIVNEGYVYTVRNSIEKIPEVQCLVSRTLRTTLAVCHKQRDLNPFSNGFGAKLWEVAVCEWMNEKLPNLAW